MVAVEIGHINRRFINCRFKRIRKLLSNQEAIVTEYVQLRRDIAEMSVV